MKTKKCPHCKTVFEYTPKDVKSDAYGNLLKCTNCKKLVSHSLTNN